MKQLPKELDEMFHILAREEEKAGGMKADVAFKKWRDEFIGSSLTAMANPVLSNPRKGEGHKPEEFDPHQLALGISAEMEHTDDPQEAQRIAIDHLVEDREYYTKLQKMESGACNPTFEEEFEVEIEGDENPTKKPIREIAEFYFNPLKKSQGYDEFGASTLGKKLTEDERNKLWHEIELMVQRLVVPMLEKVMGLNLKEKGAGGAALKYPAKMDINLKRKLGPEIEKRRYMKLYMSLYLTGMIMNFINMREGQVSEFMRQLEGGKDWEKLRKHSNRRAFAKAVKAGMDEMLKEVSPGYLSIWAQNNRAALKKFEAEAAAEQAAIEKKLGAIGKVNLEKFKKKLLPVMPEKNEIVQKYLDPKSEKIAAKILRKNLNSLIKPTAEDIKRHGKAVVDETVERFKDGLFKIGMKRYEDYLKEGMGLERAGELAFSEIHDIIKVEIDRREKQDIMDRYNDLGIAAVEFRPGTPVPIADVLRDLLLNDPAIVVHNRSEEVASELNKIIEKLRARGADINDPKSNALATAGMLIASRMTQMGIMSEEEAAEKLQTIIDRMRSKLQ